MSLVHELEEQNYRKMGEAVLELATEAANFPTALLQVRQIEKVANRFLATKITAAKASKQLYEIGYVFRNANEIKTQVPYFHCPDKTYTHRELPAEFENFYNRLNKLAADLSTPRRGLEKLYRAGTIGHGVLQALSARGGCRSKELRAFFSVLNDSSTLTHMRREGLIEKQDKQHTAPFTLTVLGREILRERGIYTFEMYEKYLGAYNPTKLKVLPWELPMGRYEKFVGKETRDAKKGCF